MIDIPLAPGITEAGPSSDLYPSSKPCTRWWWFSGPIREEDVRYQLDWLKASGFGGVEIEWVYPLPGAEPGPRWLSPEWSSIVAFTKRYCDSLGLGCDFGFGTLWPFGGSIVPPEDASQTFSGPSKQRLGRSWEMPYSPPGLILNHLDRKALEHYSEKMAGALGSALKGSRSALFCDSWEVEPEGLWTPGFDERFRDRFGYDLPPFKGKLDEYPDVRYDYRKLLAEYVLNEFFRPFTETSHRLGCFSRVQPHGAPTDLLAAYAAIDVPESEAILFDPHCSQFAASAATLTGRNVVSCESFTCLYGWKPCPGPGQHEKHEQLADIKLLADALFANGVNQIVWHGMPYNPPGGSNEFYATVHVGPDAAFARELPEFNRRLTAVSSALRTGRNYTDVAVHLPLEDNWMRNLLPDDMLRPSAKYWWELQYQRFPEELRGWRPTWVTTEFLKDAEFRDGLLHCGAAEFRWLYLDVEWLAADGLREISRLSQAGLPVVMVRRPHAPGCLPRAGYGEMLRSLASRPTTFTSIRSLQSATGATPLVEGVLVPEGREGPAVLLRSSREPEPALPHALSPVRRSTRHDG